MKKAMSVKKRIWLIVSCMAITILLITGAWVFAKENVSDNNISNGVYIGGVDVSGMTRDEASKAVEKYVQSISSSAVTFVVDEHEILIPVSELGFSYKETNAVEEAFETGKSGNVLKRYKESKQLEKEGKVINLDYNFDEKAVKKTLSAKCTIYDTKAVDAGLIRTASGFQVTEGTSGHGLDLQKSVEATLNYLNHDWQGVEGRIELVTGNLEPKGTSDELSKVKDLLATATTSYSSSSAARSGNIQRGSGLINGKVLYPGEEFSTYQTISPITVDNGYFMAPSYEQGKVVETPGGGICQVSTTLYNAVLKAELEVKERSNHSMIVKYVDPSMDAAIAGTYKDFKFINNTNAPIYIEAVNAGKQLTFNIYGMETRNANRKVKYESETVSETEPTTVISASGDNFGKISTTQGAHKGLVARLWKIVYENGVEVSRTQVNQSKYQMAPKYISVGTANANAEASAELSAAIAANDEAAVRAVVAKFGTVQNTESTVDEDTVSENQTQQAASNQTNPNTSTPEQGEQTPQTPQPPQPEPTQQEAQNTENNGEAAAGQESAAPTQEPAAPAPEQAQQ